MAGFSYADAVKLLGAKESMLVSAIDKLLSGALLGGSVLGLPQLADPASAPSLGDLVALVDLVELERERPDLVKRLRFYLDF